LSAELPFLSAQLLYRPPGRLYFHFRTFISKTKSICQRTFFTRRTTILKRKGKLLQIHQPPPTSTLTMAVSKAGFVYPRTAGHENDGDITWCKFVIGFPNPSTRSPEYNTFRKAMKRKMEQERIPGFVGSTADQWAAIQAHALTIPPVPHRAPLWQTNTRRGQRFTECFDYLLRDIAKKHKNNLENLLRAPVAGPAAPAAPAAPVAAVNDRKSSQNICTE
jgi:hypothetical protein